MSSWIPDWEALPPALLAFWTERHLCTLTTVRADGRPHVVPVGVALDLEERCAWVITSGASHKARRIAAGPPEGLPIAACQVDGGRWSTIEGRARVLADPASVRRAEERYAALPHPAAQPGSGGAADRDRPLPRQRVVGVTPGPSPASHPRPGR